MPATISMTPTMCMKVAAETGTILVASGLRYICQSVSLLKNLSRPATIGPIPRPSRKAHQAVLKLSLKAAMFPPSEMSGGQAIGFKQEFVERIGARRGVFFLGGKGAGRGGGVVG